MSTSPANGEISRSKWCPDCGSLIDVILFGNMARNTDGLSTYCKKHQNVRTRLSYNKHKEKRHEYSRNYHRDNRESLTAKMREGSRKITTRYSHSKNSAKRRGFLWGISMDMFSSLVSLRCFYCHGPSPVTGSGLDRKDNSIGYIPENVVTCCMECNTIKGPYLSFEEMVAVSKVIGEMRSK